MKVSNTFNYHANLHGTRILLISGHLHIWDAALLLMYMYVHLIGAVLMFLNFMGDVGTFEMSQVLYNFVL